MYRPFGWGTYRDFRTMIHIAQSAECPAVSGMGQTMAQKEHLTQTSFSLSFETLASEDTVASPEDIFCLQNQFFRKERVHGKSFSDYLACRSHPALKDISRADGQQISSLSGSSLHSRSAV